MEEIKNQIKELEEQIKAMTEDRDNLNSNLKAKREKLEQLKDALRATELPIKGSFYLTFLEDPTKRLAVNYIDSVDKDGNMNVTTYEVSEHNTDIYAVKNIQWDNDMYIPVKRLKKAVQISAAEWNEIFVPLILDPVNLDNKTRAIKRAYDSNGVYPLVPTGTGHTMSRSHKPISLAQIVVLYGDKPFDLASTTINTGIAGITAK